MTPNPEALARIKIDDQLTACGWKVQDRADINLHAGRGVAVREFLLQTGFADYLLFVDKKAVGVIEAKQEGSTLSHVAEQAARYSVGLPENIPHVTLPLPFLYESTGVETFFRDERDPQPRSRRVFSFHRPETLADWLDIGAYGHGGAVPVPTLRARLQQYPPLNTTGLWKAQIEAINNLETSLSTDKPRALIQMATGSGKTFTAVSFIYHMLKFGKARRVFPTHPLARNQVFRPSRMPARPKKKQPSSSATTSGLRPATNSSTLCSTSSSCWRSTDAQRWSCRITCCSKAAQVRPSAAS
jgi:type I restriction enzyme R subunit